MAPVFSKDDFTVDIEEADLYFNCPTMKVYIIDNKPYKWDGTNCSPTDPDDELVVIGALAIHMKNQFEWYMPTRLHHKFLPTMKKYEPLNTFQKLKEFASEIDYPTMRDADCPYQCDGCKIMRTCHFCGQSNSQCSSVPVLEHKEHESVEVYFCDHECRKPYTLAITMRLLNESIESTREELQEYNDKITLMRQALRQKGQIIKTPFRENPRMIRKEAEAEVKDFEELVAVLIVELNVFESLSRRDKTTFDREYLKLKDAYVEIISTAGNDEICLIRAKGTKDNIEMVDSWMRVLF